MGRDARILSLIAGAVLLAAIVLIAAVNFGGARPGDTAADAPVTIKPAAAGDEVAAGKMAANFTLTSLDGKTVTLSKLRGKVVFLNIWATWCGPCREEMPSIEKLYEKLRGNPGFVILAVSQDSDGKAAVAPFMAKYGFKFPVLLDPSNKVGDAYDVSGIPETFIIDQQGRIVAHHLGPYDWANPDISEALVDLVKAKNG